MLITVPAFGGDVDEKEPGSAFSDVSGQPSKNAAIIVAAELQRGECRDFLLFRYGQFEIRCPACCRNDGGRCASLACTIARSSPSSTEAERSATASTYTQIFRNLADLG